MTFAIPYLIPLLAKEVGPEIMGGVLAAADFWWTLEDKYPLAKLFVEEFLQFDHGVSPYGLRGAPFRHVAVFLVERFAGTFYPPDVIKQYEKGETFDSLVGPVHYRPEDHRCVRPVIIVRGKKPNEMKNKEDYWEILEVVPGEGLMQKPDAFGGHLGEYT